MAGRSSLEESPAAGGLLEVFWPLAGAELGSQLAAYFAAFQGDGWGRGSAAAVAARADNESGGPEASDDDLGNDKRCRFNMTQRAFHSHRTLEDILLSDDYDATSRPEVARERDLKNKPTAVTWTLATKGFSISEKANTVTLTGDVTETWVDERLAFNYTPGDIGSKGHWGPAGRATLADGARWGG